MQAEYDEPHAESSTAAHAHDSGSEDGGDVHDGQDGGDGEAEGDDRPEKKKRIIKSRQSLAEKKTGTTLFPMARIKRIIKADKELDMMSTEATFLVAVATEYFIKHFMEEGYTKARIDRRRIVNYKDMANVVARSDEFDFLRDVVPLPIPMSDALAQRKAKAAADDAHMHGEAPPRPAPASAQTAEDRGDVDLSRTREELPPPPVTNPLFPGSGIERPSDAYARSPVSQSKASQPRPPVSQHAPPPPEPPHHHHQTRHVSSSPVATQARLSGKNAPTTPVPLATRRSSRRSLNAQDAGEAHDAIGHGMEVDEY